MKIRGIIFSEEAKDLDFKTFVATFEKLNVYKLMNEDERGKALKDDFKELTKNNVKSLKAEKTKEV